MLPKFHTMWFCSRVANSPEFFQTVQNFLVLSGKRRLTFADRLMSEKVVVGTICSVISVFYSSKQYYRIFQNLQVIKSNMEKHTCAAACNSVR